MSRNKNFLYLPIFLTQILCFNIAGKTNLCVTFATLATVLLFANNNNGTCANVCSYRVEYCRWLSSEIRALWKRVGDNVLSVTTSQCGSYLRGISTSILQGYHRVKSADMPTRKVSHSRETRSKIANESMFMCIAIKNLRRIHVISYAFISVGVEKSNGGSFRVNIKCDSLQKHYFSYIFVNENRHGK